MQFKSLFIACVASFLATMVSPAFGRAMDAPRDLAPRDLASFSDPFYTPPAGFESTSPGSVLRSRKITASFFSLIPAPVEAYQVLYRTTAINGSAIASVTTIFKPMLAKRDRFVSYHVAYDSSASTCSPSYSFKLGGNPIASFTTTDAVEFLLIEAYLLSGYIVSAPDYEGPDAAFTPGLLAGMGVLDSMRAVNNFGATLGLTKNPAVVGAGYSGGGLATAWAAAMHPAYAPELSVKGWSAGGIPANLSAILEFIDGTVVSGFELVGVAGWLKPSAYGAELQPIVDKIATPIAKIGLAFANANCALPTLVAFPFQSIMNTAFQSLGPGLFDIPVVAAILKRNTLGVNTTETPIAPVWMYHATPDEVVPYAPAAKLNEAWCSYGATVKFTNYAAGGHGTTVVLGIPDSLQFVNDAFAGRVTRGCTTRDVATDQLSPLALGLNLEPIAVGLINFLATMGKKDSNWMNGIKKGKPV